ncbi:MAG TPA: phage holin family protein [Propionicimonas sp.]|jgi:hypothetical protein|uniref:phage holin family protein n=1 Tax=Propionicimonas sp. TaxID=1955623 RepID=UPI002F4109E8
MSEHAPVVTSGVPPLQVREERSIGELMGDVTRDLTVLLRQEVELAKAELRESASRAGKGSGLLAGAGVAGFLALLFGSIALWWGLGLLMGNAWSGVVVAVIWAVVAAVLMRSGRGELSRVRGLPTTAETVSKIPNALKGNEEENR